MDERIRAAERSGDRLRLVAELHRVGRRIDYKRGDRVKVVDWPGDSEADKELAKVILGMEGTVIDDERPERYISVHLEKYYKPYILFKSEELEPVY